MLNLSLKELTIRYKYISHWAALVMWQQIKSSNVCTKCLKNKILLEIVEEKKNLIWRWWYHDYLNVFTQWSVIRYTFWLMIIRIHEYLKIILYVKIENILRLEYFIVFSTINLTNIWLSLYMNICKSKQWHEWDELVNVYTTSVCLITT